MRRKSRVNIFLQKLNMREKILFATTIGLVLAFVLYFAAQRAMRTVTYVDNQIATREGTLLGLRQMEARGKSIEDAYSQVAAHHSSAWTEQEIHDRLRLEIYRLAMLNPPPEDRPEMVRVAGNDFQKLVNIPALRQGTLLEGGGGDYREYQLRIVLPDPTPVRNVIEFLRRLQESKHSLRIDAVELVRPADGLELTNIRIDVTRTVVNSVPGDIVNETAVASTTLQNAGFETWFEDSGMPEAWQVEGMQVQPVAEPITEGELALQGETVQDEGMIYQQVALIAGRTYDLAADIAVTGKGRLSAATADGTEELPGGQKLEGNGAPYRYSARLVPPGKPGQPVQLRIPLIAVEGAGSSVIVDNVTLREGVQ